MNAQNVDNTPKVRKESKNKIRVDFDRTPLKERLKAKFLSLFFVKKVLWYIVRLVLLVGISYIVLFPYFTWIAGSFMSPDDFVDVTVRLIPKNFTLDMYKAIWEEQKYLEAFTNTLILSASTAVIQTFVCAFVAYGLAKFKFKGNGIVFMAVVFSLIVPHQTLRTSLFMGFRYFDIFGIFGFLDGGGLTIPFTDIKLLEGAVDIIPNTPGTFWENFSSAGVKLTDTYIPLIIMSLCGLAFKNGLYIFMLRQFYRGVPDELEESAYIDGSGIMHTFFTIILPLSVPMMITVFVLSFSWQWTDTFYTRVLLPSSSSAVLMSKIVGIPTSLKLDYAGQNMYESAIRNTCGIMIMIPLLILYLFCQKYLVQGIERSGLTAD